MLAAAASTSAALLPPVCTPPSYTGRSLASNARHPASGSPRYAHELDLPDLRFWPLKRYPCLVFYVERRDHIDVWRVLHGQRDIPAWLSGTLGREE